MQGGHKESVLFWRKKPRGNGRIQIHLENGCSSDCDGGWYCWVTDTGGLSVSVVEWTECRVWSINMSKSRWTQFADVSAVVRRWSSNVGLIHAVSCRQSPAAAVLSVFSTVTAVTCCHRCSCQISLRKSTHCLLYTPWKFTQKL